MRSVCVGGQNYFNLALERERGRGCCQDSVYPLETVWQHNALCASVCVIMRACERILFEQNH